MENEKEIEENKKLTSMFFDGLINFNRFLLKSKPHIKKYNKLRKLHSEILDSMEIYIVSKDYDSSKFFNKAVESSESELKEVDILLNRSNDKDNVVITELFVYKTSSQIPSITEIYIKKNKYRNLEKQKMLNSMNNSYVSLFKIVDKNLTEGTITYQDVYTNKKYKIIDVAMSTTIQIDVNKPKYIYNRIITYEDISFGTGIPCVLDCNNKNFRKFLKNKSKNKNYNNFTKCLILYDIKKHN